jgi:glucose uptake protein
MLAPHSFGIALLMMILSTVCWGSWANAYKATPGYRFELFYWDYTVGIVLLTVVLAFTMGSTNDGPLAFLHNVHSANAGTLAYAAAGGFLFNIANTLLVAGIEIAGLAIAFPLAIGIALVEGVVLSYWIQPKGSMALLGAGVAMALLAVVLIGKAYASLAGIRGGVSRKGVTICIVSGFLMGAFAPLVTRALTAAPALTPYSTAVFFAAGALLCCFVFNVYLMRRPLVGTPVPASDLFRARGGQHLMGIAGGVVWGVGLVFNLVAANLVGVSVSYAIGQASPMIAAIWGVFVWKEFRSAGQKAKSYLAAMFIAYLLALLLIAEAYRAG